MAADRASITTLLHSYGKCLSSRSLPEVLQLYTPDGVLMAPGYTPSVGQDALKSSYTRIFETIRLEIEFSIDEIVLASATGGSDNGDDGGECEWAFARTTAAGTKFWLQRGTQEIHSNQELFVCRKVEGEWKIARYCFSSMKPLV